jgi:glucose/arabinose dehydrogenase
MIRALATLLAASALAGCGSTVPSSPANQLGPNPALPDPSITLLPGMHLAKVSGWKQGEAPSVPQGFRVQMMANGLSSPRNVYPLPNGDILVVQSLKLTKEPVERPKNPMFDLIFGLAHKSSMGGATNQITLLRDANGDGKPELQSVLVDHLNSPFGVVVVGNSLYVADTDAILRFPFTPGQTRITAPPQKVIDLPAGLINHHWTKSLTASPDGSKLYVGVGSNSNTGERGMEAETNRAAIWEVDPKTGAFRLFASGLRNPNGLNFYPGSQVLWTVVNERDELGSNLVPDYMTSVEDGGFYGWPYSYWGQHVDPRVRPQQPDLVKKAIMPDYSLSSHVAPLGLTFYSGASFPAQFSGGAFVGEHGSWNRPDFNGYRVVFIPFRNGRPAGKPVDFMWDFVGKDGKVRGRPVGVAIDRTGALIVADDVGNTVWRVSYAAARPQAAATRAKLVSF